jgi:hypothetical protein
VRCGLQQMQLGWNASDPQRAVQSHCV